MAGMCRSKLIFGHPLITILGCTGTGKSKLAIELAKTFNGEVINADAMQMYQGLDIITNKVTEEEQEGIRHHLLGFLDPKKRITVAQYKNSALDSIGEIIERKKLPIIVGGTFYYVESVLYDFVIGYPDLNEDGEDVQPSTESKEDLKRSRKRLKLADYEEVEAELEKLDDVSLHNRLREVDPEYADMIHPNCRRKVLRGILVHQQFGEKLSSILSRQKSQPGASSSGGPLKFTNSLILLLQCNPEVLRKRLDERVDDMLSKGLLEEILEFQKARVSQMNSDESFVKGMGQSIGFKEFQEFLNLDEEKRETEEGQKAFEKGVDLLKLTTRQYAKEQVRWIRNRLLTDGQRQAPPIYVLDVSDLSKWEENVMKIAKEILDCHLVGKKPSVEPVVVEGRKNVIDKIYYCECGKFLQGKVQYDIHMKSKSHQRRMKRKRKLEKEKETAEEASEVSADVKI